MSPVQQDVIDRIFDVALSTSSVASAPTNNSQVWTSKWHKLMSQLPYQPKPGDPALGFDGAPIPGSRFVERIVTNLDNIYQGMNPARMEATTEAENAAKVCTSLRERKFVPTDCREGIIVARVPSSERMKAPYFGKDLFLIAGFHRCDGHKTLRVEDGFWGYIIADIYEYDTPLAQSIHAGATNCHNSYQSPSNDNDVIEQVNLVLREGRLPATEPDIRSFVEFVAAHMPKKTQKKIIGGAVEQLPAQLYGGNRLQSLTSNIPDREKLTNDKSVHLMAKRMNLPVEIGKGASTVVCPNTYEDIQTHFSDEGAVDRAIHSGLSRWHEEGCPSDRKVFLALYVNTRDLMNTHTNPKALQKMREKLWNKAREKFESHYDAMAAHYRQFLEAFNLPAVTDADIRQYAVNTCPVILAGFLPQVVNPDPQKGGVAVETTMVDWKGQPYDYRTHIGRS